MVAAIAHDAGRAYGFARVCDGFGVARSSFYAWRRQQERAVCGRPRRCRVHLGLQSSSGGCRPTREQ
jgi:transposase-like protein